MDLVESDELEFRKLVALRREAVRALRVGRVPQQALERPAELLDFARRQWVPRR